MASKEETLNKPKVEECLNSRRVVIVTGGSRGIGKGIVLVFLEHGWNVVFCSNHESEGRALEDELHKSFCPERSAFVNFEATNENTIKNVILKTIEKFGKIDCLINNVGTHPSDKSIDDFSAAEFRELFEINVMSHFFAMKFALPYLRKTNGSIVNVSSLVASIGQNKGLTYCATKGAISAMTKALAIEEAPNNVRINSISPSNIWTPLYDELCQLESNPEAIKQTVTKHQLISRFGTPEECGRACYYLGAEATFSTGMDLLVSGGAEIGYGMKTP